MLTLFDQKFTDQFKEIAERYSVQAAYLFGSQAFEYARSDSDVDIGVFIQDKKSIDYLALYAELSRLLDISQKLDLVVVDLITAAPLLLFEISKGKLLYEQSEGLGPHLQARSMHLYYDDEHRRNIKISYLKNAYAN